MKNLASKVITFCNIYRLYMFYDSIHLQYVGIYTFNLQKMTGGITLVLSKLKRIYTIHGNKFALTFNDLFSSFKLFIPLLYSHLMSHRDLFFCHIVFTCFDF